MEGCVDDNFTPVISGVKIVDPKVESDSFQMWWGGITGWATKSVVIENSAVTGADINLPKAMAGGIVGEAPGPADIKNCFFEGSIVGAMVGGICSEFRHGKMSDCYVDAELACTKSCGGLIANTEIACQCFHSLQFGQVYLWRWRQRSALDVGQGH